MPKEFIARGDKRTDLPGILTFFSARFLDPFLQYGLLARGWGDPLITLLHGSLLRPGPPLLTHTPLDHLGLSPYRALLLSMSVVSMVKQNYWLTALGQERMSVGGGLTVGLGNAVGNSLSSLLFVCAQTSASVNGEVFPQTPVIVGSLLFVAGILVEVVSEQQRYDWKQDAANKGKVYEGGLFALARHVNYFGYALWRAGYILAAGGWTVGAIVAGAGMWQFATSTIPLHEKYMDEKVS